MRILAVLAIIAVRVIDLSADPPSWLSWSTGIFTDEGFYTLDARSEVLFHHWAIGNFHDRLLSPLLSLLQQAVFSLFGPELLAARLLSVVFSLLTLLLLWLGLKQAFSIRAADAAVLFLGLAPPYVFYNRLALQETPTVFWLVLAFTLWAGAQAGKKAGKSVALGTLSGVCVAAALIFKPVAVIALPAFAYLYLDKCPLSRKLSKLGPWFGFAVMIGIYGLFWFVPHHIELSRMGRFYRVHQFQPHTAFELWLNIRRGFVGGERGVLPYLLATLPVPMLLVMSGLFGSVRLTLSWERLSVFFIGWLTGGLALCFLSSYAPSRYYVLFLPALAGLAGLVCTRLSGRFQIAVFVAFLLTSLPCYLLAWKHREYSRQAAAASLVRSLPPHSVLVGEFAPGLGLDTPFATAPVQPGLSNDKHPVSRLHATEIAVTQTPYWIQWWKSRYPNIIQPSRHIATFVLGGPRHYVVFVYRVTL